MRFKDGMQQEYEQGVKNNTDPYGARIYSFAKEWAELMEREMDKGRELKDVADQCSREADTDGITGFMYGAAVSILWACWEHGDQLVRWHNHETPGACSKSEIPVNPAIVTIGVPDK